MIRDKFIHYHSSRLHYAKTGNGEKHLLVFHGFGQDMGIFEFFTQSLGRHYTFYVFDLYFHGKSEWNRGEQTLSKKEWKEIMALFFEENGVNRFSLAAFSLGGKFALATLEAFPAKVELLYLIAPDGIKTNFWYSLATYPLVLRRFFKSMIVHPRRFQSLTQLLYKSGVVDKGLIRFAEFQMNSEEKRNRVYFAWVVFRQLTFDPGKIARLINDHQVGLTLIVGKYDKVIKPKNMNAFLKKVKHYKFEVLESGHTGLINLSLPFFMEPKK